MGEGNGNTVIQNPRYKCGEGSEFVSVRSGDKRRRTASILTDMLRGISITSSDHKKPNPRFKGGRGAAMVARLHHNAKYALAVMGSPQKKYDRFKRLYQTAFGVQDEGYIFRRWVDVVQLHYFEYEEVEMMLQGLADDVWRLKLRYKALKWSQKPIDNALAEKLDDRFQKEWQRAFRRNFRLT